jgi:hypothetical protein
MTWPAPTGLRPAAEFAGLAQNLHQVSASNRDSHSNCWANLRILGQLPCKFYARGQRPVRGILCGGAARTAAGRAWSRTLFLTRQCDPSDPSRRPSAAGRTSFGTLSGRPSAWCGAPFARAAQTRPMPLKARSNSTLESSYT